MPLSFWRLESSLIELAAAQHEGASVVGTPLGKHLYHANRGWGILWSRLYGAIDHVSKGQLATAREHFALCRTHDAFQHHIAPLQEMYRSYDRWLGANGRALNDGEFKVLQDWIWGAIPAMTEGGIQRINRLFQQKIGYQLVTHEQTTMMERLWHDRHLLEAVSLTPSPLPRRALRAAIEGKRLTRAQRGQIRRWTRFLNDVHEPLTINALVGMVYGLVDAYGAGNRTRTAASLVLTLQELGIDRWEEWDPEQTNWVNCLTQGTRIYIGDRQITLGQRQLLTPISETGAYSVVEDERIAIFPANRMVIPLWQRRAEESWSELRPLQVDAIDPDGRSALVEKIRYTLETAVWERDPGRWRQALTQLIARYLERGHLPSTLSPRLIGIGADNELVSLQPVEEGEFDFFALEKFLDGATRGYRDVYEQVARDSGLADHRINVFMLEIVRATLADQSNVFLDVQALAVLRCMNEDAVVTQAKWVVDEVRRQIVVLADSARLGDAGRVRQHILETAQRGTVVSSLRYAGRVL